MRYVRPILITLIAIAAFLLIPNGDSGVTEAGSTEPTGVQPSVLQALSQESDVGVIISLRTARPPTAMDLPALMGEVAAKQASVLSALSPGDFTVTRQYDAVPAIAGRITAAGIEDLADNPDVLLIEKDGTVYGTLLESVPLIKADLAQATATGEGIQVAVLDTGVNKNHNDLSDGDILTEDCYLTGPPPASNPGPCPLNGLNEEHGPGTAPDGVGHGTHVTGIITSCGDALACPGSTGLTGVAPDAQIHAYKVLNDAPPSGSGLFSDMLAALNHIITTRPGVDLVNMSIGDGKLWKPGNCDGFSIATAINMLRARGTTTVVASGNGALKTGMNYPACVSTAVSVGMTYDNTWASFAWGTPPGSLCTDSPATVDTVTCASNSDVSLDLLAPGAEIESLDWATNNGTALRSGTSMAAPHVVGVMALVLENDPTHTPDTLEYCLESTGSNKTDPLNGIVTPRVDALAALTCNKSPAPEEQLAIFSVRIPDITVAAPNVCTASALLTLPGLIPLACSRAAPTPDLVLSPAALGLDAAPMTDELDAISLGEPFVGPLAPAFHFSVDAAAVGAPGCAAPDVLSEATIPGEADGDIFTDLAPPASPISGCNALFQDELVQGLNGAVAVPPPPPPQDDMDALTDDYTGIATPCPATLGPCPPFSVDPASPVLPLIVTGPVFPVVATAADLLVPPGTPAGFGGKYPACPLAGGVPCIAIPAASLGLDAAGDDLDALCWFDNHPDGQPDPPPWLAGVYDSDDYFFSLAPGSPTLGILGVGPGAILAPPPLTVPPPPPGSPPVVVAPDWALGLAAADNLDALKCINGGGGAQLATIVQADLKKHEMYALPEPDYGGFRLPLTDPPEVNVSEQAFHELTEIIHNNGPEAEPVSVLDIKKIDCPDPGDLPDFQFPLSVPPDYPTQCSWVFDDLVTEVEVVGGVQYWLKRDDDPVDGKCDPPYLNWFVGPGNPGEHTQIPLADLPAAPDGLGPPIAGDCIVADSAPGVFKEIGIKKVFDLDVSVPTVDYSEFDIHCLGPSDHTFVVQDELVPLDGVEDPDPTNNTAEILVPVACIADADVKLQSQTVTFPGQIDTSTDYDMTIDKVIHNNGPWGPVDVDITKTFTLPPDCTVNGLGPGGTQVVTNTLTGIDVSDPATDYQELDTIHCSLPSDHQITVQNCVDLVVDPHIVDPDPSVTSNCDTDVVNFQVLGKVDGKIVSSTTVNPPPSIPANTDVPITVRKVLHNNGPYGPADFTLTGSSPGSTPPGCTVTPPAPSPQSLPASTPVQVDETWTINCPAGGPYTIVFDNTIAPDDLHVVDTDPTNDDGTTSIEVTAGELQLAIFSVQPPDIIIPGCEPAALLTLPTLTGSPCPRPPLAPDLASPPVILGLDSLGVGTDNLDAVSLGDVLDQPAPEYHFSVDTASVGVAGCPAPDVNSEATAPGGPEAHGDIFTDNTVPNCNAQYQDEVVQGLNAPGAPTDDMDALTDQPTVPGPCLDPILGPIPCPPFSIDPFSTTVGSFDEYGALILMADLLVPPGTPANDSMIGPCTSPGGLPCVAVPAFMLGLDVLVGPGSDDLDALCWFDHNGDGLPDSPVAVGGPDDYLFSLAPGSATLGAMGFSPADILTPDPATGLPRVAAPATYLGLLTTDNLDALKCFGMATGSDLKKVSMSAEPEPEYGGFWDPLAVPPQVNVDEQAFFLLTEELHNNGPDFNTALDIKKLDCPDPSDPPDFAYIGYVPPPSATQCSWVYNQDWFEVEIVGGVQYYFKDDYTDVSGTGPPDGKCDPPKVPWFNGSDLGLLPGEHGQFDPASLPPVPPAGGALYPGACIVADSTPSIYQEIGIKKLFDLDVSVPVTDYSQFDVHCLGPSFHTFTVEDTLQSYDLIEDPDPTNNTTLLPVTVACVTDTDLKLLTQNVTFPPVIDISQNVDLITDKEIHNNGGTWLNPVDVTIDKLITLPPDCTVNGLGPGGTHQFTWPLLDVPVSTTVPYQEIDTIHCTEPSYHTLYVDNCVYPTDEHIIDYDGNGNTIPDGAEAHGSGVIVLPNHCQSTQVDFVVNADADVKVTSVTGPPPLAPTIFQSERHVVTTNIHNNGPDTTAPAGLYLWLTEESPPLATNPDSDGDGWVDSVEMIFQSSSVNPLSTPEGMEASPSPVDTCTDGNDNDLNGLTDAADPKCVDSDGDGLSDGLEFALGGAIVAGDPTRQPEHGLLPWTCNDLVDNDNDGRQDDTFTNPGFEELDGPDPDSLDDCSHAQIKQIPPPVACVSGWRPLGGERHRIEVEPAGAIIVTIGFPEPSPGVSTPVAVNREVVIDCFTPGVPVTENITARADAVDIHVTELNPGDNENTTTIDVEATAAGYADIKIVSWDTVPPVPGPDIDVSQNYLFDTLKVIHNNGGGPPTGPVDVTVTKTMNVPDGCDGSVHSEGNGEIFDIAAGVTYGIDTDGDTIPDPPPLPDGWQVAGPNGASVGPLPFSNTVIVKALPVLIDDEIAVRFDVIGVDVSAPVSLPETFDMHCYEPSTHEFVLSNLIYIKSPDDWADPDPTNNYKGLSVTVNAIAYADLKILDQQHDFPTDIDVSQNALLVIYKLLHNNGPFADPVDVNITKTITLPPDCTIDPWPPAGPAGPHGPGGVHVITGTITLDESVQTPYWEYDDIHCTEPSPHVIEVENCISPVDPHVIDPYPSPASNCRTDTVNFNVLAYTDGKIVSSTTVSPPSDIAPYTDVPIQVQKVLHNNGPYGPADFTLTGSSPGSTPPGCTVTPPSPSNHTLAVSVPSTTVNETWYINCQRGGPYTIDFDNTIAPTDPHVVDTDLTNDTGTTSIVVTAGELQEALFSVLSPDIVVPGCEPAAALTLPGLGGACPRAAPAPDLSIAPGPFGLDILGGPGSDDMDALSFTDVIDDPSPERHFSVDLASPSVGAAGCPSPDVNSEATAVGGPEAHGDIFTDNAPPNCNALYQDELQQGLNAPGAPVDDMDALTDLNAPLPAFSINWASALFGAPDEYGSPILGADLLVPPGVPPNDLFPGCAGAGPIPGSPCVYVPGPSLGLDTFGLGTDDLDALCWFDNNGNWVPDSTAIDDYFFSLAPGSASLDGADGTAGTGDDLSPADILAPGPFPTVTNPAASLGLLPTDNLDALKCFGSAVPADGKILSATIPSPVHGIQPNTDTVITVHKELHNNGPLDPADFDLTHSITPPAGCTVTPPATGNYTLDVSVTTSIDEDWTVNCPQGGPYVFTFENTLTPSGNVFDPDTSNNSGSAILSLCAFTDAAQVAGFDCDGDGYPGGSTGLADEEDRIFSTSVPSTGRDLDPCGNDGWPSELFDGLGSENKINLQDVTSFVMGTPPFKFGSVKGGPGYDERWNLFQAGASIDVIDLQDITAILTGPVGGGGRDKPPMFGGATRTFDGPSCPWPP